MPQRPLDATLAPHAGSVALQIIKEQVLLHHTVTHETVELPQEEGGIAAQWSLHFDARGYGYLVKSGKTEWVQPRFCAAVFQDKHLGLCVETQQGGTDSCYTTLDEYRQDKHDIVYELPGTALGEWRGMVFTRTCQGARCWWSLPQFFCSLKLSAGSCPSKWMDGRWKSWHKYVTEQMGLGALHLRNSVPSHSSAPLSPTDVADRVAEYKSASTFAIVALCVRWATAPRSRGGMLSEDDRTAVGAFAIALFRAVSLQDFEIDVALDPDISWSPPLAPCSSASCRLSHTSGHVDAAPLAQHCRQRLQEDSQQARALGLHKLAEALQDTGPQAVSKLLQLVFQHSGQHRVIASIYRQLIWAIGGQLDRHMASQLDALMLAQQAAAAGNVVLQCKIPSDPLTKERYLHRYFLACRRAFEMPQLCSMSVDFSRVGGHATMLGAIALPNNLAVWAPPQVLLHKSLV